jgi:hypothetical protein
MRSLTERDFNSTGDFQLEILKQPMSRLRLKMLDFNSLISCKRIIQKQRTTKKILFISVQLIIFMNQKQLYSSMEMKFKN